MRLLTKSRFKQGLECPNKLYFTNKNKEYANNKLNDSFLKSLAQGGFQVEELARIQYPGGHLVDLKTEGYNYTELWEKTQELLKQENVIIYEAAFLSNDLFIRVDILVKTGNKIELIEVKAKSYNPNNNYTFINKKGKPVSSWKPYLFDVAFQNYVMQQCYPDWHITNYLLLADKSKKASIAGLNQMFRAVEKSGKRTGIITKFKDISELGESILSRTNIDDIVDEIQNSDSNFIYSDELASFSFAELIKTFATTYKKDKYYGFMPKGRTCKKCEYNVLAITGSKKSGYEYCYKNILNWENTDFDRPLVTDIWNLHFSLSDELFNKKKFFMDQLEEEDLKVKPEAGKISSSERKWIQVEKVKNRDNSVYVLQDDLKTEMNKWIFPLHFIDFETSTVALPFMKGMHPYEQVAFQYSHHIIYKDGRIEHASEFINANPGVFPNFKFVRSLKRDLENDNGTIFKFATHENTVLNQIHEQLQFSKEVDKNELQEFIESITVSRSNNSKKWKGNRDMVDLNKVIVDYYYNPLAKGSNSIKAILPASLKTSDFLKNKYSKSIGELGITSKNFDANHIWLNIENNEVQNPYKKLPPVFLRWDSEKLKKLVSDLTDINDGGQALTAYGKLQYTNMNNEEREAIIKSLLKYCELDTMAMVMIYEHLKDIL